MTKIVRLLHDSGQFLAGAIVTYGDDAVADALIASGGARITAQWTFNQFMNRMTQDERMALASAAASSPQMFLWFAMGSGAMIEPTDPDIKTAMDGAVSVGLLTQEREDQILNPAVTSP